MHRHMDYTLALIIPSVGMILNFWSVKQGFWLREPHVLIKNSRAALQSEASFEQPAVFLAWTQYLMVKVMTLR